MTDNNIRLRTVYDKTNNCFKYVSMPKNPIEFKNYNIKVNEYNYNGC